MVEPRRAIEGESRPQVIVSIADGVRSQRECALDE